MAIVDSSGLNNPVWAALTGAHAHLAEGQGLARLYPHEISPFAGICSPEPEALNALKELLLPGNGAVLVATGALPAVPGLSLEPMFKVRQMIDTRPPVDNPAERFARLGPKDAPEMLDLAQRTKPGPFGIRTREMGNYIGLRHEGQLIAMAGERFRLEGYTEISAVCVDDAWRGRGIASRLMSQLRKEIHDRGETAFLHVRDDSLPTIGLYERLGFSTRAVFQLYKASRTL